MDIDAIWNSLKEEDGTPFATSRFHKSINKRRNGTIINPPQTKDMNRINEGVDACLYLFCGLDVAKTSSKVSCEDSDDEDRDAEDNQPSQSVSDASWRIERVAKTIVSDDQSTRVRTLSKLKDAIEALLINCTVPPHLKYPPPYDNDQFESMKNLPLVSDFVKPKLLEGSSTYPMSQEELRVPKHRVVDESMARLQIILNSCGKSLFRVIGDGKSKKCSALALGCLQSLLLAGIDFGRHIPYMIPALRARLPQCAYDKDMEVFVRDPQLHDFYKRGGATTRQDKNPLTCKGGTVFFP
jgi:hypothetical protein